jgi:ubiquitin-conjugating enzyme E2 variant
MTKLSWWESSRELVVLGALMLAGAWMFDVLTWQVWLFVALSVNANQVHKWSHQTRAENGPIIARLQDWKILQTPHHHGLHHKDPKNTYYCPITNFVNPVLERVSFWNRLENVIERLIGITHREDTAVRGNGPGPEWLNEFRPAPRAVVVSQRAVAAATPATVKTATLLPPRRAAKCARNCANCPARCERHVANMGKWETVKG